MQVGMVSGRRLSQLMRLQNEAALHVPRLQNEAELSRLEKEAELID